MSHDTSHNTTSPKRAKAPKQSRQTRGSQGFHPPVSSAEGLADGLLDRAKLMSVNALDSVLHVTRERPAMALGVALGVGFALGGALWTRAGRVILLGGAEAALRSRLEGPGT